MIKIDLLLLVFILAIGGCVYGIIVFSLWWVKLILLVMLIVAIILTTLYTLFGGIS